MALHGRLSLEAYVAANTASAQACCCCTDFGLPVRILQCCGLCTQQTVVGLLVPSCPLIML